MKRTGSTLRIGFVMTVWSATVLLGLHLFQVFDEGHETVLDSRTRLSQAVAITCSQLASRSDRDGIAAVLESFVERDRDVLSARFRRSAGPDPGIPDLTIGDHEQHWTEKKASYLQAEQIAVPVYCADQRCGSLEIAFRSPVGAAVLGFIRLPSAKVTVLASSLNLIVFSIWLRRCFRRQGQRLAALNGTGSAFDTSGNQLVVSAAPGVQSEAIGKTLERLKASQREIEEQNKRLTYLATRDPVTGCLNRRSLHEHFAALWRSSKRYQHPLSCVMVDIDHFKSINDQHGHSRGDRVLTQVATALMKAARETDFVCRYGGEEFCILLPHVELAGAWCAAERFRKAIESLQIEGLRVTASLGCSDREQGAADAEQLLDQADQALYYSKKTGRNRTTSFDHVLATAAEFSDATPCGVAVTGEKLPANSTASEETLQKSNGSH